MTHGSATWSQSPDLDWKEHRHALRDMLRMAALRHQHHKRGRGQPFGADFGRRGFGFGPGGPFGGGRRAARGDIRAAILALLNEQPMHGYQIIQELDERTHGAWRPSPGSVYPTLQQLEDEGLVRAVEPEAGRRAFELTEAGRQEASAASGPAPWDAAAGDDDGELASLRDLLFQAAAAGWQVARTGNARQIDEAKEALRAARKRLYQILAEDSPEDA